MGVPIFAADEEECSSPSGKGTRDEGRASALRALEGLSLVTGFSKVEIPEWNTPDAEKTFHWNAPGKPD